MRWFALPFVVLTSWAVMTTSEAQVRSARTGGELSVAALSAVVEVETTLLEEEVRRVESMGRTRREALARLNQFFEALELEVGKDEGEVLPERIDQLLERALQAELTVRELLQTERDGLRRIRTMLGRIAALDEKLEALRGERDEELTGLLTGTWDLVLLPLEQRGSCVLEQSGAVVNGTYRLEGGYNGSLQGTLVDRKVYLVRIDSRLGKMMEFEGFLSGDGKQIRGSWLNYELAGSQGSTGQWSARRRTETP